MSWPVTMYYCTNCDFEQGNSGTWGTREYVLGSGVRIPVRWHRGWCESCNGLAAIEDLSIKIRIEEYREAQHELQLETNRLSLKWIFGLSKSEKSLHRMYEDNMEDAIDALEMLECRKAPPRCLRCSSTQVHVPKRRASNDGESISPCVYSENGDCHEKSKSSEADQLSEFILLHPGCGGEILARPFDSNGMRFALKQSIQRYTPEGCFIEKEYVGGYSAPDQEYFDARSVLNRQYRSLRFSAKGRGSVLDIPHFLRKQAD